jgi:hypothetical protein
LPSILRSSTSSAPAPRTSRGRAATRGGSRTVSPRGFHLLFGDRGLGNLIGQ